MGGRAWMAAVVLLLGGFLAFGQACPTVGVIIPETVIIQRRPIPVPDPAAETAIIREFLKCGFHVVDQAQVKFLHMTDPDIIERARNGDLTAIRMLSERFAAKRWLVGWYASRGVAL